MDLDKKTFSCDAAGDVDELHATEIDNNLARSEDSDGTMKVRINRANGDFYAGDTDKNGKQIYFGYGNCTVSKPLF